MTALKRRTEAPETDQTSTILPTNGMSADKASKADIEAAIAWYECRAAELAAKAQTLRKIAAYRERPRPTSHDRF